MNTKFKKIFSIKKNIGSEEHPYGLWVVIIVALGVTAALIQFKDVSPPVTTSVQEFTKADTFIPKGHTLVPIEIANYESLDSIIGKFGVVDLFSTPLNPGEKSKRIAYAVKMIRAPRNPSHFAVLMPEEKVEKIAGHIGPFTVTVRNPKETGTKFVQESPRKRKRRVSYDLE